MAEKVNLPLSNAYSFYRNYTQNPALEQNLYQNLADEQINLYGADLYYLPREKITDDALSDITFSNFTVSIKIRALLQNVEGFSSEQEFITKFDLYISDEVRFLVSTRQWDVILRRYAEEHPDSDIIKTNEDGKLIGQYRRPIEGDLIYFALTNDLYEIKYVNQQTPFYQFGEIQFYELKAQIYSNVGNEEISIDDVGDISIDENKDKVDDELGFTINENTGIIENFDLIEEKISPSITITVDKTVDKSVISEGDTISTQVERRVGSIISKDAKIKATGEVKKVTDNEITLINVTGIFKQGEMLYDKEGNQPLGYTITSNHLYLKDNNNGSNNNAELNKQSERIVDWKEENPLGDLTTTNVK